MRKTAFIALLALAACSQQPDAADRNATTTVEDITPDADAKLTAVDGLDASESDSVPTPSPTNSPSGAAAASDWTRRVTVTKDGGYRMGNPDAKVKLVEYGARTCPSCGEFGRTAMKPIASRYVASGRVSYEFRDFAVHGLPDIAATLVGQCGSPETFFPVLEATYANQQRSLTALQSIDAKAAKEYQSKPIGAFLTFLAKTGGYVDIAERNGLAKGRATACLADEKAAQHLVDLTNGASKVVEGTPTFLINGRKIDGHDWTSVEKSLKAAGA